MQKEQISLLLVDDDEDDYILVRDLLHEIQTTDFSIHWVDQFEEALSELQKDDYDVYLIDYRLGENNGLELLKKGIELGVHSPIIMLTGKGFPEIDYQAMQMGAADYLVKDGINAMVIERSIRYAINNTRTMNKLYEEEQKYRTLFEQSVNAIYITNQEDLFMNANWAMTKLVGYELHELHQLSLRELFAKPEEYTRLYQLLTRDGLIKDFETSLKHKNKKLIAGSISATRLVDSDQNLIGYQGIIADVSEKKKVQQELIRLEKMMMAANIARSIAHEVRNPLTNINLSLEQFASEITDRDDLEVYLDIIRRNTKRINELITAMLNSSKPSQLSLQECSLNDVLDKTLSLAADRIKLREVGIERQYTAKLTKLPLDQDKLVMAFLNIVNNAIEAVERGAGEIVLDTSEDEEYEYVAIKDNGHGIEPDEIDKLFDAFHTGKRGGMGLGLTSTQNIVNSHKARISVESKPGEGTCFKIIFPKKAVASLVRK
uniref:histidine kinase n=1 Tax=Roseihalotalea indica TaxID=2867963 RepID=A0AA49GTV5_9BACT|nr:ATP-binding protein [Tunicatimonas sp. TK19036]